MFISPIKFQSKAAAKQFVFLISLRKEMRTQIRPQIQFNLISFIVIVCLSFVFVYFNFCFDLSVSLLLSLFTVIFFFLCCRCSFISVLLFFCSLLFSLVIFRFFLFFFPIPFFFFSSCVVKQTKKKKLWPLPSQRIWSTMRFTLVNANHMFESVIGASDRNEITAESIGS